jgi:uncharacterized protein
MGMRYGWDEGKRQQNLRNHGVDFTAVYQFNWDWVLTEIDDREDYDELRERATGFIGAVPHILIFTRRADEDGEVIWVISLRKANRKERRNYERSIED